MRNTTLILSGGGVKGFVYCGVLKAYHDFLIKNKQKNLINQVISVSVGSIFSFLWIIGYNCDELVTIFSKLSFDGFNEFNFESLLTKYGLNSGNALINQISELIVAKNISAEITLLQLYQQFHIDYTVLTTNINLKELNIISFKNNPHIRVIDAIRMAISIPFLFTVKKFNNHLHVDAAVLSNFPVDFIQKSGIINNKNNVIGINIINNNKKIVEINNFVDYMKNLLQLLRLKNTKEYNIKTCYIPCDIKDELLYGDFNLSNDQINKYIDLGYRQLCDFLLYYII
jgi:NTE family protein